MELKFTLIACTVVAIASVLLTYNYTSNHYEAVIAKDKTEQVIAAQETTKLVAAKERKNAETTQALNAKALEQSKTIANQQNELRRYRTSSGGMLVKSTSCNNTAGTSDSAASNLEAGSAKSSIGSCLLSGELTAFLAKVTYDADDMRGRLLICKDFAEQIDRQRERIINDNKE